MDAPLKSGNAALFAPDDKPAEQQHVRQHRHRPSRRERIANGVAAVNERHTQSHAKRASNLDANLNQRGSAAVD